MKSKRQQHSRKKNQKTDDAVIARRRSIVATLTLQAYTQPQIAEALGRDHGIPTSQPTVCLDLKHLMEEWRAHALTEYADQKIREINACFNAERIAWENFELSCRRETRTPKKDPKTGKPTGEFDIVKVRIPGDTRWHAQAMSCVELRCKLFGLTRDIKVEQTVNNSQVNNFWERMSEVVEVEDPLASAVKRLNERVEDAEVVTNNKEQS